MELFEECRLGPVRLRNRFIKAATFEGRSPGGAVTDDLISFHRTMAAGGVAMTTVAYLAVSPDGGGGGERRRGGWSKECHVGIGLLCVREKER